MKKNFKTEIKNREKEGLILYVVLLMSHVLCDQEVSLIIESLWTDIEH